MKQERARRLDDERTGKRTAERLGARCAGAWLDAAIAPKASQVAWLSSRVTGSWNHCTTFLKSKTKSV
jgi:hypothetical protein